MALRSWSYNHINCKDSTLFRVLTIFAALIFRVTFSAAVPAIAGGDRAVILDVAHLVSPGGGLEIASQNALGFDEKVYSDLQRAVIVQGTGLSLPKIDAEADRIVLTFKDASVRGGGFLLPVFRAPVEFIETIEEEGVARVIIRLSHKASHELTERSGSFVVSLGPPGDEISESGKSSDFSGAGLSGSTPKTASVGQGEVSLPRPGDGSDLRPRLKDVDIVEREGFDGIEVRLKFSRETGFRTISLPGSHVIMVPRATLEYGKSEIVLNKRGIRTVNLRETEGFLRIVVSLQDDSSVKVEESGRRIRLFVTPAQNFTASSKQAVPEPLKQVPVPVEPASNEPSPSGGHIMVPAKEFIGPEDPDASLPPEDKDRKALLKRLEKLIETRRAAIVRKASVVTPASVRKDPFPAPVESKPVESPDLSAVGSFRTPEALKENAEAILRLAEEGSTSPGRGLVQVRSADKFFLGIPLDKGASHRIIATANQLIIEVRNSEWRAPWTFKRLTRPMKFARAVSKGKGFTLIVAFDGKTCSTPDVEETEGGLSVVLSADVLGDEIAGAETGASEDGVKQSEPRNMMEEVREAAAEASKAIEATKVLEAVASRADPSKVLSITKEEWASGEGLAKLKAMKASGQVAAGPAGPSGSSPVAFPAGNDAARPGQLQTGPAPVIVRDKGPRPILPRDGVFSMTPPPGEGFVRMTSLRLDDLVGGKRLTAEFEGPVKAKLIKARSQAIVIFEKAWYSGSDPVRMVFDDPVKVVRLSTGRQDLKAIVVLTMDADVRLRNDGNSVIVEVIGLTDKQRKAVTELSTLGRRRITRRREDVLKKHLTPVPENEAGSTGLFGLVGPAGGGLAGTVPEGTILVRTPSGDELPLPDDLTREQLKERLLAMADPDSAVVSGNGMDAVPSSAGRTLRPGMFGAMDSMMEYADSASIKRSLADAERKAKARELYLQGLASAERSDWISAHTEYTESLKLAAGDVNVIRALNIAAPKKEGQELFRDGNVFSAKDEWQKAVWAYSEAMRKDPSQPKYSFAWEGARKTAAVMTVFDEAMDQYKDGQYGKAIDGLRQVTEARPGWVRGILALGRAYEGRKWYKASVMTYAKAIEVEPNNSEALAALDLARKRLRVQEIYRTGKSLEEAGKFEDAAAEYRKALSLEDEFRKLSGVQEQTYIEEAKKLYDQGRLEDALGLSEKAIKIKPEEVEAHYWKAKALMGLGRITEAVVEFKKVVELDPKNSREISDLMM